MLLVRILIKLPQGHTQKFEVTQKEEDEARETETEAGAVVPFEKTLSVG